MHSLPHNTYKYERRPNASAVHQNGIRQRVRLPNNHCFSIMTDKDLTSLKDPRISDFANKYLVLLVLAGSSVMQP